MNIKKFICKNKVIIGLILGSLLAGCVYFYLKNKSVSKDTTEPKNSFSDIMTTSGMPSSSGNDLGRPLGGNEVGLNIISPPIQSEVNLGSGFGRGAFNEPKELDNINYEL